MADKMIRVAGRDTITGNAKSLSMTVDENGDGALRVVDAAPFAYDDVNNRLKVSVEKSVMEVKHDLSNDKLTALVAMPKRTIVTAFASALRTANESIILAAPEQAKGAIVWMFVSAVSGTFIAGEGARIRTRAISAEPTLFALEASTARVKDPFYQQAHIWQQGATKGDATAVTGTETKVMGIAPQTHLQVFIDINGTFTAGQGITCRCSVVWIM